ncbi:MAG: strictosidine synthase family protein [Rhodobacteraceae bacterium]|nr:strictosidine synthase family protein [Paracoccaceae bacterium]
MFDIMLSKLTSFGNGRSNSLSVPVFDGAFKPNNLLEEAETLLERTRLEDLVADAQGQLFAACGSTVLKVAPDGTTTDVASFDTAITALAILPEGGLCVALGDRIITGVGSGNERTIDQAANKPLVAVTAMYGQKNGGLLVCDGSAKHGVDDWSRDLMEHGKSGRLIRLDPANGQTDVLASGLAYAFGAYDDATGDGPLVSESWNHGVRRIRGAKPAHVIDRLPGYPSRFAPAGDGGFWLTICFGRTQLVEFVLKENDYRQEMMRTIDPKYWIAPAFGSGADFREPLQAGGVKQMGYLKPWAPPRSYGLLVRYGADLIPQYSLHSRVGGAHHGINAAAQIGDTLYALSKGSGRILKLSVSGVRETLAGKGSL